MPIQFESCGLQKWRVSPIILRRIPQKFLKFDEKLSVIRPWKWLCFPLAWAPDFYVIRNKFEEKNWSQQKRRGKGPI